MALRKTTEMPSNYAEYLMDTSEQRYEIIDGTVYDMTPAPTTTHQRIVLTLGRRFGNYLEGKTCEVFVAPFDVRLLSEGKDDKDVRNVVQPDVAVVCDPSKIDEKGCNGSPDLVIEVLSPSTAKKDRSAKMKLYRLAKIKEYWIVDPYNQTVEVIKFKESEIPETTVYAKEDEMIIVGIFEDFEIHLKDIFS